MYAGVASTQSSSSGDDENDETVTTTPSIIPGTSRPDQGDDENENENENDLNLPSFGGVRRVYFESM